jgi:hypothetical protein
MESDLVAGKVAGASTREMARERYRLRLGLSVGSLACLACIQCLLWSHRKTTLLPCIVVAAAINKFVIPCLDWLKKRQGHASRGAQAEENVGAILDRLPENCRVLHDVNTGRGNIDHVVFRQDGTIFLIETKSHRGTVSEECGELRRNGAPFEKDLLKQTHGNVYWLRDLLTPHLGIQPWINAAIVFPNAFVTNRRTLRGVDVMNAGYLERWMARAKGNPQVAKELWPQIGQITQELRVAE